MDDRQRRIGENEVLFRDVNERVKEVSSGFTVALPELEIVCECGDPSCAERIDIAVEDYARVRSEASWFVVRPGHVYSDVEGVVDRGDGYEIVEKNEGAPAELARQHDPRS